jgi:predicted ATPase
VVFVEPSSDELVAVVGSLSSVQMDEYAVVGSYMRFGEKVREQLKDARVRIAEACAKPAKRRDNHLLWAAPGSGKTYFIEQTAASLPEVAYVELNLAKLDQEAFVEGLGQVIAGGPTICLIDEVDAKPAEPWPYEVLMPCLDVNLERGGGIVFVLAGSSGSTLGEFRERIGARAKGKDVLSRVPEANSWEIAPMDAGDRILVALSQMLNAASELGRVVSGVEKLALHYLAAAPHLANARQLREFAVRAVERGSSSNDRIRYDDLFDSGDPENKRYWMRVMPEAQSLVDSFVLVRRGGRARDVGADTRSLVGVQSSLPVQLTTFVGRDRELAEVAALLAQQGVRLVTLTGPGGTGKTRLALEAAGSVLDEFADGVFVVSLATAREAASVVSAVAQALGVREQAGETLAETVASSLRGRELLLVLDNFEQVVEAAPLLAHWLMAAVGLRLLVTSRVRLHLSGEQVYDVRPLNFLPADRAAEPSELFDSDAAQLFLARARAARPDFALDEDNAEAVGAICARLDGLPLALELAAARVRVLSAQALLARLDLGLLTGGARDLEERQQTMAATIAWSYHLLDAEEQQLFARVGVFVGGFRFESAEAVVAALGDSRTDLFDKVTSLVEKSLLAEHDDADGEPRFYMLETIREYARERLSESGETAALTDAHAHHFLALADEAEAHWQGRERDHWLTRLASDYANIEAALTTLHEADPDAETRLAANLGEYWEERGLWAEGRARLAAALAHSDRSSTRVRALLADGWLAVGQGAFDQAAGRASEAVKLAEPDDIPARAFARHLQAAVAYFRSDPDEAEPAAQEALDLLDAATQMRSILDVRRLLAAISREGGDLESARARGEEILATSREHADQQSLARALDELGMTERLLGNFDIARELLSEALDVARSVDARETAAHAVMILAQLEREAGDNARARVLADEAVEVHRSLGAGQGLANSLFVRARSALADGDLEQSRIDTQEALRICDEIGSRQGIIATLEVLSFIAVADHDSHTAVFLIGAAQALRDATAGFAATKQSKAAIADTLRLAEADLGADTVRDLEVQGANTPIRQVIDAALGDRRR